VLRDDRGDPAGGRLVGLTVSRKSRCTPGLLLTAMNPLEGEIEELAYVPALSNSNATTGSSPPTQASWPGSITYAPPGPTSPSDPSLWVTWSRPLTIAPRCLAWHESVPTTGLTHSDHFHPGSNVKRAAGYVPPPDALRPFLYFIDLVSHEPVRLPMHAYRSVGAEARALGSVFGS
jgi:hypothetical protein